MIVLSLLLYRQYINFPIRHQKIINCYKKSGKKVCYLIQILKQYQRLSKEKSRYSITKYILFLFPQLREWKQPLATYNVERKVSFCTICAAENREFYAIRIFIPPSDVGCNASRNSTPGNKRYIRAKTNSIWGKLFLRPILLHG